MNTKDVEEMLETWYKSLPERPKSDTDLRVNKKELSELITTHRTQLLQEIEGEVESIPRVNPYDSSMNYTGGQQAEIRAYNRAFEDILTIIRNKQIP